MSSKNGPKKTVKEVALENNSTHFSGEKNNEFKLAIYRGQTDRRPEGLPTHKDLPESPKRDLSCLTAQVAYCT